MLDVYLVFINKIRIFKIKHTAFFKNQLSVRENNFSQILFMIPDINPSDSQITCCLFITTLCTEFQEVHTAAPKPSLHTSHSRALTLILKFVFYMITSQEFCFYYKESIKSRDPQSMDTYCCAYYMPMEQHKKSICTKEPAFFPNLSKNW